MDRLAIQIKDRLVLIVEDGEILFNVCLWIVEHEIPAINLVRAS